MSALILKIIALITMTIDHIAVVFSLSDIFRCIGRIAFPLYALMIVDGCNHLINDKKRFTRYLIRIGIMAVISELAFDLCFYQTPFSSEMQNQILQFFTYILGIYICDYFRKPYISIGVWVIIIYINFAARIGYFSAGIIYMLIMKYYLDHFMKKNSDTRLLFCFAAIFSLIMLEYTDSIFTYVNDSEMILYYLKNIFRSLGGVNAYTLLAVPFLARYNGEYGPISPVFRKFYFYYYPLHLFILSLIQLF